MPDPAHEGLNGQDRALETLSGRQYPGILVLGLGGTYCSGKSTVARALEAGGARQIDVDRLGHEALQRRAAEVVKAFGPGIILASGAVTPVQPEATATGPGAAHPIQIDRKALGRLVFADPDALRRLEAITHPVIRDLVRERLAELAASPGDRAAGDRAGDRAAGRLPAGPWARLVVVNAALLLPLGLQALCDLSVFVDAPWLVRYCRGLRRDHLGPLQTWRRLGAQKGLYPNPSAGNADIPIVGSWTSRKALGHIVALLDRMTGENC